MYFLLHQSVLVMVANYQYGETVAPQENQDPNFRKPAAAQQSKRPTGLRKPEVRVTLFCKLIKFSSIFIQGAGEVQNKTRKPKLMRSIEYF